MMKSIVRTLGAAFILTGVSLYFIQTPETSNNNSPNDAALLEKISSLEKELSTTKAQLASLQTDTLLPDSEVEEIEDVLEDQEESTAAPETEEDESDSIQSMVLVIERGMASPTIVNALVKAGIIENQFLFEQYLIESGLNKKIQIGEYNLDSTMDFETIAKIITKS
jgi:hypothetical protein